MKKRQSTASRVEREMFEYTHRCDHCRGVWFSALPGRPDPQAAYLCHRCRQELTATVTQIRSEEEARFNVRWNNVFKDPCPDCGTTNGHRVTERPDMEDGVHFLVCGGCGEELREVEEGELRDEEG